MFDKDKKQYFDLINQNKLLLNLLDQLLKLQDGDFYKIFDKICAVLNKIPGCKFTSLVTYHDETEEIVYRVATCQESAIIEDVTLRNLVGENVILELKDSLAGELIMSDKDYLFVDNVCNESKYKSKALAEKLELEKGYFLKIKNLNKNKETLAVIILYPENDSPLTKLPKNDYKILISTIEYLVFNVMGNKKQDIHKKIVDAARKVQKDLSSFLEKAVEIIQEELKNVKGCSIFTVDPVDNLIKLQGTLGIVPGKANPYYNSPDYRFKKSDVYYSIGEGQTGKIVESGEQIVQHNPNINTSKWVEKIKADNFIGIPIKSIGTNKCIGVIRCATESNCIFKANNTRAFSQEDIEMIEFIAEELSIFIELSNSYEYKKQLLFKMPHEIKSSLANINSICDFIFMYCKKHIWTTPETVYDKIMIKLKDIRDECEISHMTVENLSAYDEDVNTYNFVSTNIRTEIVNKISKMLGARARNSHGLSIDYERTFDIPPLMIDKPRMQVVFHNLLNNAIKYSYKHKNKNIKIIFDRNNSMKCYTISISNYGIAIPEINKKDIFIHGFRTPDAGLMDPNGKGFGLALARQILKNHEIDIEVTSFNNPTVFTMYIPFSLENITPEQLHER